MTRRTFCKLVLIGFVAGVLDELSGDDDGEPPTYELP